MTSDIIQSDKPRVAIESTAADSLDALRAGNSGFALNLYRSIQRSDQNLFFSPHSISQALAMTYAGARGETERQMADALQFRLPQDQLHPAFNTLDMALASRGEGAAGRDEGGFRLNIVNAIWGQAGYQFRAEYLDLLAEHYGAGLRLLDFVASPEASRLTINDWVVEQTEDRIKDVLPPGAITPDTRLTLTNAIYFNAAWLFPFEKEATQDGVFTLIDGDQITVPMMAQQERLGYAADAGYQAVELLYDGGELSMVVLLPDEGQFEALAGDLDVDQVDAILAQIRSAEVNLTMPRFTFETGFSVKTALSELGMPNAFSPDADFSGMTDTRELTIDDVFHKAFVSVDEAGTEAAAATAIVMKVTSMPTDVKQVRLDRPFIFMIRDLETGTILFLGQIVNPSLSTS